MSQRNADYMQGWRDALALAASVEVTRQYAETVTPNRKRLPEPDSAAGLCPVCGLGDNAWVRCDRAGCCDGRGLIK
jgi:hypothetical protein